MLVVCVMSARFCPHGAVCFRLAMIFPGDFVSQFVPAVPVSPGDLELDALFENHEVSWLAVDEMFALSGRFTGGASERNLLSQHCGGTTGGNLRDLAATTGRPPHSALFSLQLLDLAHRWSETKDNDFHIVDVLPLAASLHPG